MEMWTALRIRPHFHRLDYDDHYDEDYVALLHHLSGLIHDAARARTGGRGARVFRSLSSQDRRIVVAVLAALTEPFSLLEGTFVSALRCNQCKHSLGFLGGKASPGT
jgi:hypothetical protein